MAKKPKPPKKRGPVEDRLVIKDDPSDALQRLLKTQKPAKPGK